MEDLTTKKEQRVQFPEGWNSYDGTWIKKDDFKDQKGKEITDIDDKIKKFIELLNNVDVSKFEGGITNFCFRFPYIVKDIFGTECKLQKGGWFGKDKSTNPFDYKGFCDAIFNFIDTNSRSEDAKKQNYCLLLEMIFMKSGFIGSCDSFNCDGTLQNMEDHISYIFTQKTWTHMPIISSMFMEKLCSKITNTDIEKYNFKFVLQAENNDQEISKYGSIVINRTDINNIETLNKLKLSYYKALWNNKFNPNESKDFFARISFISVNSIKIDLTNRINQCTNLDNSKNNNKEIILLPKEIIESKKLTVGDKSSLLQDLFKGASEVSENTRWNMVLTAIDSLSELLPKSLEDDAYFLSNLLNFTCKDAVSIKPKEAYKKIGELLNSVGCLINTDAFNGLFNMLRGNIKKGSTSDYLNVIDLVAKKLASNENTNYATKKLETLLDLVKCKEKKYENENSQDQDQKENTSNKKEESDNQKNVEIVNKNINSDIFQSLFEAINKCYPLFNDNNEFNSDNFSKRNELRNTLFKNFLKVDKKLKNAQDACDYVVKQIMDDDISNKFGDGGELYSKLVFLIDVIILGRETFSANPNESIVTYDDIKKLISAIRTYFTSNDEKRYESIEYLFEMLGDRNVNSDVFVLLFDEINKEFPLLDDSNKSTIPLKLNAEDLKKRNELLGKLSNISVIVDSKKNKVAQERYFETVNKMMEDYPNFLGKTQLTQLLIKTKTKTKMKMKMKKKAHVGILN